LAIINDGLLGVVVMADEEEVADGAALVSPALVEAVIPLPVAPAPWHSDVRWCGNNICGDVCNSIFFFAPR